MTRVIPGNDDMRREHSGTRQRALVDWIDEGRFHVSFIKDVLHTQKTRFQLVEIAEVEGLGRCLLTDGSLQSASVDEYVYHEALVHPAMSTHSRPERVLILGGGEGATLREVMRYRSVRKVFMIDIDKQLVRSCSRYLKWDNGTYSDERVTILNMDGSEFIEDCIARGERFDIIISDLSDPMTESISSQLYTREFYENCGMCLCDDGVFVTQAMSLVGLGKDNAHAVIRNTLGHVFQCTYSYIVFVPSYIIPWSFCIASNATGFSIREGRELSSVISKSVIGELYYYDEVTQRHMFSLPKNLRKSIESCGELSTRESPVAIDY